MHKAIVILFVLLLCALPAKAQVTPLSLPIATPIACSAQAGCFFLARPNTTVILVARFGSGGTITSKSIAAETWSLDQCVTFTGDCAFHANFGPFCGVGISCMTGVSLTFSGNQFSDVLILMYDGLWNFDSGNYGTYADQNSAFPDCTNGGDCPYAWTLPIDTEAGALIICWGDVAGKVIRAGPGFTLEGKAARIFVEDMIAPTTGVYIGSWMTRADDGSENGGFHWLAGVAAYKKSN